MKNEKPALYPATPAPTQPFSIAVLAQGQVGDMARSHRSSGRGRSRSRTPPRHRGSSASSAARKPQPHPRGQSPTGSARRRAPSSAGRSRRGSRAAAVEAEEDTVFAAPVTAPRGAESEKTVSIGIGKTVSIGVGKTVIRPCKGPYGRGARKHSQLITYTIPTRLPPRA